MRFRLTEKEARFLEHLKHIFSHVFQLLLFLFLITLLVREFYPELIGARININWFMFIVILSGVLSVLFPAQKTRKREQFNLKDKVLIIALGILGAAIIFLKLKELGWIGFVISILGGVIIILLSWLLLAEHDS